MFSGNLPSTLHGCEGEGACASPDVKPSTSNTEQENDTTGETRPAQPESLLNRTTNNASNGNDTYTDGHDSADAIYGLHPDDSSLESSHENESGRDQNGASG